MHVGLRCGLLELMRQESIGLEGFQLVMGLVEAKLLDIGVLLGIVTTVNELDVVVVHRGLVGFGGCAIGFVALSLHLVFVDDLGCGWLQLVNLRTNLLLPDFFFLLLLFIFLIGFLLG